MANERMTAEQIEAIRKRADDNGEWVNLDYMRYHEESPAFKKHAREDVSALLAEVERLQAIEVGAKLLLRQVDNACGEVIPQGSFAHGKKTLREALRNE